MSPLDSLPPDQRAVLQLVLGQGRSYADIAAMLKMEPEAVRSRAQAAAEALAAGAESRPPAERREEIVDYLLGQQPDGDGTRACLAGSAGGRAFAWALVPELAPLATHGLPEIPEGETETETEKETASEPLFASPSTSASASAPRRSRRSAPVAAPRRSSRLGGALLLAGVAIVVAVGVVLLVSGGDDKKKSSASTQTSTQAVTTEAQINLAPAHKGSKSLGVAQVLRQNGVRAMAMIGQDIAPTTTTSFYAVWLYNSPKDAVRLGFTPAVGSDKKLQVLIPSLPKNAARFKELILTNEHTQKPTQPGVFILRGPLSLSAS